MADTSKPTCPGCGAETYLQAPPCDCGRGWWRKPSWSYWPVQVDTDDDSNGLPF